MVLENQGFFSPLFSLAPQSLTHPNSNFSAYGRRLWPLSRWGPATFTIVCWCSPTSFLFTIHCLALPADCRLSQRQNYRVFSTGIAYSLFSAFPICCDGKILQGRLDMEAIHQLFKAQDFIDIFTVGLLNPRHILVTFHRKKNFHRFYSRMLWYVGDFPMRVFKWTSDFHADRESSIVLI